MNNITPPEAGEDTDLLWRVVRELTARANALSNLTVTIHLPGAGTISGRLEIHGENSVLSAQ